MKTLLKISESIKSGKKGQGMVEYGLIIALIAIVVIVAIRAVGTQLVTLFNSIVSSL